MAKLPFYRGGRGGASTVTPKNASAQIVKRNLSRTLSLGTGAVTTATYTVGLMPIAGKVLSVSFAGQSAVTGTSLTAEVLKRSADGNTATTLQASATDVKITASTDKTSLSATLTATTADLTVAAGVLLEVTVTANSVSAGPGDLAVQIVFVPSEDSLTAVGLVTTGADL